jgi:hypothetical protein
MHNVRDIIKNIYDWDKKNEFRTQEIMRAIATW